MILLAVLLNGSVLKANKVLELWTYLFIRIPFGGNTGPRSVGLPPTSLLTNPYGTIQSEQSISNALFLHPSTLPSTRRKMRESKLLCASHGILHRSP